MGIPPEMLGRLFEPFVQAEQALDRRFGGLGLGLALVKGFVERHDGTVEAASEGAGHGATFTVTLPVEAPEAHESMAPTVVAQQQPRRVLVIEDNVDAA